eukprot:926736-Rhodomonas_salina.1
MPEIASGGVKRCQRERRVVWSACVCEAASRTETRMRGAVVGWQQQQAEHLQLDFMEHPKVFKKHRYLSTLFDIEVRVSALLLVSRLSARIEGPADGSSDLVCSSSGLRACYAMSSTDIPYGGIGLRSCYAMPGTELALQDIEHMDEEFHFFLQSGHSVGCVAKSNTRNDKKKKKKNSLRMP